MKVKVRRGRVSDFENISRTYWRPEVPWDPIANPRMLKEYVGAKGFLVAEVDGEFAGFLHYLVGKRPWFDEGTLRYGEVLELFVRPEHQGNRVSVKLLKRALSDFRRLGCSSIYTHTDEKNQRALGLYRKFGFKPILRTFYLRRRME